MAIHVRAAGSVVVVGMKGVVELFVRRQEMITVTLVVVWQMIPNDRYSQEDKMEKKKS